MFNILKTKYVTVMKKTMNRDEQCNPHVSVMLPFKEKHTK